MMLFRRSVKSGEIRCAIIALVLSFAVSVCSVYVLFPALSTIASATTTEELEDEIAELDEEIAEAEEAIEELEDDIESTSSYIATLDAQITAYQEKIDAYQAIIDAYQEQIDAMQAEIEENEAEIEALELQIAENEATIVSLQEEIESKKENLKSQIRYLYITGETSELEILLCSDDYSDYLIKEQYVASLADYQQSLIDDINDNISSIETLNEEIAAQQEEIEGVIAEIEAQQEEIEEAQAVQEAQQAEIEEAQAVIEEKRAASNTLLAQLSADQESYEAAIEQYEADQEALEAQIQAILSASASTGSGTSSSGLIWPLQYSGCYISSYMTTRTSPITGKTETHGGIDICISGGSYGKNISAAASGTVVIATYHYSYGYYIMIDHGDGLSTLYAHCSVLYVSVGDTVSQGDIIGLTGDTGYATGAHLHFEVRVNGSRVDPLNYVSIPS